MTRPELKGPLGSYDNREEFQVDLTIVWILFPDRSHREAALARGKQLFPPIWDAIPAVVAAAQLESRSIIPDYWSAYDSLSVAENPLAVWGIWIDPATQEATYDVSINHFFKPPTGLPELTDDHSITVWRDANGDLSACGR